MPNDPLAIGAASPTDDALTTQRNEALARSSGAIDTAVQSMNAETDLAQRKAKELAPLRERALQQVSQPLTQPPKLKEPPAPPQQAQGADEGWLLAVQVLGGLVGAATRRPLTNALAGMTGAIEGYKEGNRQKFDQNLAVWDRENKAAIESNQNALNEYKEILENRKLNENQITMALQIAAARHEDDAMAQAAKTKNSLVVAQLYDKQFQAFTTMKNNSDRLQQQHEMFREREQARVKAAEARRGGVQMSDDAVDLRAEMAIAGNPLAFRGVKAGSEDYAKISSRFAEKAKEQGMSAAEITRKQTQFPGEQSYQRTAGTMAARVEGATNEVLQLAPQALEASAALPRGAIMNLNKILQEGFSLHIPTQGDFDVFLGQKQLSDPRYHDFLMANFSLAKAYGRAMNPQGVPRVTENEEAKAASILSTATSNDAYKTQVRRLLLEVKASQEAVKRTREGTSPETIDQLINRLGLKPVDVRPSWAEKKTGVALPDLPSAHPVKPDLGAGTGLPPIPQMPPGWTVEQVQ